MTADQDCFVLSHNFFCPGKQSNSKINLLNTSSEVQLEMYMTLRDLPPYSYLLVQIFMVERFIHIKTVS
jgi:hypothetical protein